MLLAINTETPPLTGWSEEAFYTISCGGRISALYTDIGRKIEVQIAR